MTLVLQIISPKSLPEEQKRELRLDRHGAMIGRAAHADWRLLDPQSFVSSVHCEVDFCDGVYWLVDKSKNGTSLGDGRQLEPNQPHRIKLGEQYDLSGFIVEVTCLEISSPTPASPDRSLQGAVNWMGSAGLKDHAPPAAAHAWAGKTPEPEIRGKGAMGGAFAPPSIVGPLHDPVVGAPASSNDVWGRHLASMSVDAPAKPVQQAAHAWGATPAPRQADIRTSAPAAGAGPDQMRDLLLHCIAGLVALLESRARAKADLGVVSTTLELSGNNPLKFTRSAEAALAQILASPQPGFMNRPGAVADAFGDIQAHQIATLAAMQGALQATLARFSPASIRARVDKTGMLANLVPGAHNAALWKAYESEFEGVVKGSDEAFMDVFAKEFRDAYERTVAASKRG